MIRYFVIRLAAAVPTLLLIVTASFFLIRAAPGGPFDQEQTLPREIVANLQHAYGLDLPIWAQYGHYLAALAHADFGPSFKYKDFTVTDLIAQGFPVTLQLGSLALLLALGLGIPMGILAALHQLTAVDAATLVLAVAGAAVPSFVVLPSAKRAHLRRLRRNLQMVFQNPLGSLNPRMSVAETLAEPLKIHEPDLSARARAIDACSASVPRLEEVAAGHAAACHRRHEVVYS